MDEDEEIIDIGEDQVTKTSTLVSNQITHFPSVIAKPRTPSPPPLEAIDTDMDDESRKLIEQMLAEEQYYYGTDTITSLKKKKPSTSKRKSETIKDEDYDFDQETIGKRSKKEGTTIIAAALSSASLPSHKTRWNGEEDDRLKEALTKYGYGNWKLISEYVKTRNPLQCKNHARHLQQSDKIDTQVIPLKSTTTIPAKKNDVGNSTKIETPSPTIQKTITVTMKDTDVKNEDTGLKSNYAEMNNKDTEIKKDVDEDDVSIEDDSNEAKNPSLSPIKQENTIPCDDDEGSDESNSSATLANNHTNNTTTMATTTTTTTNTAAMGHCQQDAFPPYNATQDEMIHNPEWFKHKHSKTPDRYLKIRNHMLACWHHCKPKYLTKTSARKGLKDCGDVNAIGRVHAYLETVGAINVDCVTHAPRPPKRIPREIYEEADAFDATELVLGYEGPRKRKVRNERGDWVDPKELEGRVIEHGQVVVRLDTKPKRVVKRDHHQYYGGDDFGRGYDPFRLVPTEHYSEKTPAPFEVEIDSNALLVMDFHSHLAHTEIIGLLGGNFIQRDSTKILQVKLVFPCKSTSTGIQCEMDPASEMMAREVFSEKGFNVVGWYHSHPTFEPHPSIRDIENQTSYQTLFREEKTGDEPFIGVIVTPYDPEILSDHSQIQYLHISKEWDELHSFRVPYACRRTVIQNDRISVDILNQLLDLVKEYKDYEHKVNMLLIFGAQTRLEKLLDSLKIHLFINEQDEHVFLETVRHAIMSDFVNEATRSESTATTKDLEQE